MTEGRISVDGVDVRKATQESLHKNIGVVQQDVFLLQTALQKIFVTGNWMRQWMRSSGPQRWQRFMMTSWKCQKVLIRMSERGRSSFWRAEAENFYRTYFPEKSADFDS